MQGHVRPTEFRAKPRPPRQPQPGIHRHPPQLILTECRIRARLQKSTSAMIASLAPRTSSRRRQLIAPRPPSTGENRLATGLAIRASQAGHRVEFATATDLVSALAYAHHFGELQAELVRLGLYTYWFMRVRLYIPASQKSSTSITCR